MSSIEASLPFPTEVDGVNLGGKPLFFSVSPAKLIVLSTCTFCLYQIYWFYKNWQLVKHRENGNLSPAARSIFGVFFCYPLFRIVRALAIADSIPAPQAGVLAASWIVGGLLSRLPDPYWRVGFLSVLLLLPIQTAMNALNLKHAPDHDRNSRFSAWNIVGVVIGGLLFLICVYGALFLRDVA